MLDREVVERLGEQAAKQISMVVSGDTLAELLRVYRAWLDGPRVAITACNQIEGARDFDWGDMTHAAGQFAIGDYVRLVRDGDSGEGES